MIVTRTRRVVDVGALVPGLEGHQVAADLVLPVGAVRSPAFCCLPGGGASRRYWDLQLPDDDSFSFAATMAKAGYAVISLDHLGTGESVLPEGAKAPLLGQVAAANDAAFRALLGELRERTPGLQSVGLGHSMGAVLTVRQQARHRTHAAVTLLGFSIKGLPGVLSPEIQAACATGIPDDRALAELALQKFGSAYPDLNGNAPDSEVSEPLRQFATVLLAAGGMLSLLPGNVAREAAELTVPVLLANGDRDQLVGGGLPDVAPYTHAASVTAFTVPDAGHNLGLTPARRRLWLRLQQWVEEVLPRPGHPDSSLRT